jgi:hypothetical protein
MRDELLSEISKQEADLKAKKKAIDDERERIKEENRLAKQKALQLRVDKL